MRGRVSTAGRRRAAAELVAREDAELRRTARRFSLCEDDAEDAYQRALEIFLVKAPSDRPRELVGWMKTVVKHEALAVRNYRERMLGAAEEGIGDPVARLAADSAGPGERTEQREQLARNREALRALKPAELRSLTLLAAGYSYAEISEITGFSRTKVNRSLTEGRRRYRGVLSSSADGSRCEDLLPLLSTYCDGEADAKAVAVVREHLRACASCRATMRHYRATPAAVAALAPALPAPRSLLDRAHELLVGLHSRLPGGAGADDGGLAQVAAAGGSRGAGMAALAKVLAICAGTVGGAACVATGIAPLPLGIQPEHSRPAEAREGRADRRMAEAVAEPTTAGQEPAAATQQPSRSDPKPQPEPEPEPEPEVSEPAPEAVEAGAVEYTPPEPAPPATTEPAAASSGSAAGEFGP